MVGISDTDAVSDPFMAMVALANRSSSSINIPTCTSFTSAKEGSQWICELATRRRLGEGGINEGCAAKRGRVSSIIMTAMLSFVMTRL